MMRLAAVAVALVGSGCILIEMSRVGQAPTDKDAEKVAIALAAKVPASVERHTQIEGWVKDNLGDRMTRGEYGTAWYQGVAYRQSGEPQFPTEYYPRILTQIRADVLAAVEGTGVEVTWASQVEDHTQDKTPSARFEIRYLRRDREVAGEIIGRIRASDSKSGPWVGCPDVTVTHREWICK